MTRRGRHLAPSLRGAQAVLLDFDGPVTFLMPDPINRALADQARAALTATHVTIPEPINSTSDHLAVLRWTGTSAPRALHAVETACIAGEVDAATSSLLTPGADDLLWTCHDASVPVVIVTNNSALAAEAFLTLHGLQSLVHAVVGRPVHDPVRMKPDPYLVSSALAIVGVDAEHCVMVGDSVTDVAVALAAGVRPIGFGKTPRRGVELREAGAQVVVDSIGDLTIP